MNPWLLLGDIAGWALVIIVIVVILAVVGLLVFGFIEGVKQTRKQSKSAKVTPIFKSGDQSK